MISQKNFVKSTYTEIVITDSCNISVFAQGVMQMLIEGPFQIRNRLNSCNGTYRNLFPTTFVRLGKGIRHDFTKFSDVDFPVFLNEVTSICPYFVLYYESSQVLGQRYQTFGSVETLKWNFKTAFSKLIFHVKFQFLLILVNSFWTLSFLKSEFQVVRKFEENLKTLVTLQLSSSDLFCALKRRSCSKACNKHSQDQEYNVSTPVSAQN